MDIFCLQNVLKVFLLKNGLIRKVYFSPFKKLHISFNIKKETKRLINSISKKIIEIVIKLKLNLVIKYFGTYLNLDKIRTDCNIETTFLIS